MYGIKDLAVGFTVGFLAGMLAPKIFNKFFIRKITQAAKLSGSQKDLKMVFVVRSDLGMGKGKIAAQCSHAALSAYKKALKLTPKMVQSWENYGQTKIVLKLEADDAENGLYSLEDTAKNLGIAAAVIHDAGRTQIESGTATVVAIGPAPCKLVDKVTGHLKLM